jgi:DNA recombination protein RmuC
MTLSLADVSAHDAPPGQRSGEIQAQPVRRLDVHWMHRPWKTFRAAQRTLSRITVGNIDFMPLSIVFTLAASAFVIGLMAGALVAYLVFKVRFSKIEDALRREKDDLSARLARVEVDAHRVPALEQQLRDASSDLAAKRETIAGFASQIEASNRQYADIQMRFDALNRSHEELGVKRSALAESHARLEQQVESAKLREIETSKLLNDTKEAMASEFKLLAGTLLEEKGAKLGEQQKETLTSLLLPFSETLKDFKSKVEQSREADLTAREGLIAQIRHLTELNHDIGARAQSLTDALRGESKTRGIWGEQVLLKLLELAGLREGVNFRAQASHREEGSSARLVPDVVLDLPQDRAIIIDSKVSLVAYERYGAAQDEDGRTQALKEHCDSVKRHIKDLSDKNYPKLYNLRSVDFTLLFVPIESALMLASEAEPELAQYALERHIALVSPNTLFTVLRTIEYIWRLEKTTRNMEKIVKRGTQMYDAARKFAEHIVAINDSLAKATAAAQEAEKALNDPSRGLVRQAENLRGLGIKPRKGMPGRLSAGDASDDSMDTSDSLDLAGPSPGDDGIGSDIASVD